MSEFPLRPRDIFDELRKTVVGQDDAVRELSVALVKHLVGHPAPNILVIGNSGTGKTTIMRAIEQYLSSKAGLIEFANVVRLNANVLAEEHQGYGRVVLGRLYENAKKTLGDNAPPELLRRSVEHGIVFIDEVDKIRAQVSGAPNVRGIVAQEALLTLMENEHVEFEADGATHTVNSSGILFVAGGAFEELYDNVLRRATIGQDVAPLQPVVVVSASGEVREELPFHLRDYLKYEDMFRYGMTPQFSSRFESIVVLNDLSEGDLAKIFVEPDASIFRTSRDYFKRFGVDLQITRPALIAIAWDASRQKRLGARALREIYRRVIRNIEFDPAAAARDGERVLTIDENMVKKAIVSREQGSTARAR
ncbi:MAG TPA: AAA family ATPase [Thermoanaerobaculia bacterium]|jgi:ATP-dependent Clp protease ATP-binding subunit ClpX|nr:AAA family ATPase [Thermoanaerobaculia bacterium]